MTSDWNSILREASELTERGAYPEALAKYRWFHENAIEYDPSLYGVRASLAIRRWAELANIYPPARTELQAIRDAAADALRDGSLNVHLFRDVESISNALGQSEFTSELFSDIARVNPEFARECFSSAIAALVHTRDFSLARSFIASPEECLDRSMRELQLNLGDLTEPVSESSTRIKEACLGVYAEDVFRVLSVLVGVGEVHEARSLYKNALEGFTDPGLRHEMRDELRKLGASSGIDFL